MEEREERARGKRSREVKKSERLLCITAFGQLQALTTQHNTRPDKLSKECTAHTDERTVHADERTVRTDERTYLYEFAVDAQYVYPHNVSLLVR